MNVLVIYQSRNGHTREAAEAIASAAREHGCEVVVRSAAEVRKADVEGADALFVGTWVHGMILFGVRPAGVEQWVPTLPSLNGKPVGVFCTYAFHPRGSLRTMGAMLEARGGSIRGQRAFHRRQPGSGADSFVQSVLHSAS
jgi:flavodoxin